MTSARSPAAAPKSAGCAGATRGLHTRAVRVDFAAEKAPLVGTLRYRVGEREEVGDAG